jgi:hypothetical protein
MFWFFLPITLTTAPHSSSYIFQGWYNTANSGWCTDVLLTPQSAVLCAPATDACCESQVLSVTAVPVFSARPQGGHPGCLSIMRQAMLQKTKIYSVCWLWYPSALHVSVTWRGWAAFFNCDGWAPVQVQCVCQGIVFTRHG